MKENSFEIKKDQEGHLIFLAHKDDINKMNWVEGKKKWGTIICPDGVAAKCIRRLTAEGHLEECYSFTNNTKFPAFFQKTDVGIYATFNDDYESAEICMKQKCHTHIFCGSDASYVMALRMGGKGPHLGLMMTQGGLSCYSVERGNETTEENEVLSNDRGDFILHPELQALQPGETAEIRWELFWFDKQEDFEEILAASGKIPIIQTRQCTYFKGEKIIFDVLYGNDIDESQIEILCNKEKIPFSCEKNKGILTVHCVLEAKDVGECQINVRMGTKKLKSLFYICTDLTVLVRERCKFIAEKQQYHGKIDSLAGAYLIYDNEENSLYYNHTLHDHNAGRERLGMGALLALWLQKENDANMRQSLEQYVKFVYRELYDKESGTVYNDISHNLDWHRMYNYPWMAILQLEMYHLTKEKFYLTDSYRTMKRYYLNGGESFYAIGIPMKELVETLESVQMKKEAEELKNMFFKQVEYIVKNSTFYPASEVNYEQSIVAPAVSCLLQGAQLSGNKEYLAEAKKQLAILQLFNGRQPEFHQFENAIRHWDGYWFGKEGMLGDTYPHYWSVLTGVAYMQYAEMTNNSSYIELAKASFRGCLNLFTEKGRASCAMVFPQTVNGENGHFYDPWANDQDWALYYVLKYESVVGEKMHGESGVS